MRSGAGATVVLSSRACGPAEVLDLEVHRSHTFEVGNHRTVVHNALRGGTAAVYRSFNAAGAVEYVGIIKNFGPPAREHAKNGRQIQPVMTGLSRADARAVEQALIMRHGRSADGGTLSNEINSISPDNPTFDAQVARGEALLNAMGYR